jgi:hypothetical protein
VRGRVGAAAAVAAGSQRLLPGGLSLGHGVVGAPGSSQLGSPLNLSGTAGSSPSALSPVSDSSRGSSRDGAAGGTGRGLYQPVLLGTSTVAGEGSPLCCHSCLTPVCVVTTVTAVVGATKVVAWQSEVSRFAWFSIHSWAIHVPTCGQS